MRVLLSTTLDMDIYLYAHTYIKFLISPKCNTHINGQKLENRKFGGDYSFPLSNLIGNLKVLLSTAIVL